MSNEGSWFEEPEPRRILVVDAHPLFREALGAMLDEVPDLEVVGEARNNREALQFCRRLHPSLVLMDIQMPIVDGLALIQAIKREFPRISVLILTSLENPECLAETLRAGASGYILKHEPRQDIVNAIRRALSGESPLDQELAMRLLRKLLDEVPAKETAEEEPEGSASSATVSEERTGHPSLELLTPREIEVLQLMEQGLTNQEIARILLIGVSTVKKHVQHIIAKLNVSDRTHAVARAIKLGLSAEEDG